MTQAVGERDTPLTSGSLHISSALAEAIMMAAADCFIACLPKGRPMMGPSGGLSSPSSSSSSLSSSSSSSSSFSSVSAVSGPTTQVRDALVEAIGALWGVPRDRIDFYLRLYKPRIDVSTIAVAVGRVSLPRDEKASKRFLASGAIYAYTKHALRLMERIAACVALSEPVLLTGETGIGKTSVVQHLAKQLGKRLVVQNLNQQSDSSDLLGGYRPVELRSLCVPLMNDFGKLFPQSFSRSSNGPFLNRVRAAFEDRAWPLLVRLLKQTVASVAKKFGEGAGARAASDDSMGLVDEVASGRSAAGSSYVASNPAKRLKTSATTSSTTTAVAATPVPSPSLRKDWIAFSKSLLNFEKQVEQVKTGFAFWFAEGALVKALRDGDWILLDELNLASAETLQRLSGVLEGEESSISLTEKGDSGSVRRHPGFRLFAAMNPPTDFGKRDLPTALRGRFSELYVDDVDDREDLVVIVRLQLSDLQSKNSVPADSIVDLYLEARDMARGTLIDGSDQRPHYSLRTLVRALFYCRHYSAAFGVERALYEGCAMSFCTPLVGDSRLRMEACLRKHLVPKSKGGRLDSRPVKEPKPAGSHALIHG
jgi:midasin